MEQTSDPSLNLIMHNLICPEPNKVKLNYVLENGILYYRNQKYDNLTLVIPSYLQLSILQECHEQSLASHPAVTKTYEKIKQRYHWPKLHSDLQAMSTKESY